MTLNYNINHNSPTNSEDTHVHGEKPENVDLELSWAFRAVQLSAAVALFLTGCGMAYGALYAIGFWTWLFSQFTAIGVVQ